MQPTGVDRSQGHALCGLCNQREEKPHFIDTENNRQFLSFLGADQIENRPLALERPFIKEFDSAQINVEGTAGNAFVVDEVEEKLTDLFCAELFWRSTVILGKTFYSSEICLLCFLRVPVQLHVLNHSASEFSHDILLSVFRCGLLKAMDT